MFTLHSWLVSPYSAKTRALLQYKGVPFRDVPPSAIQLYYTTIRSAVGRAVMPTIHDTTRTATGEWLQDSAIIYDEIDKRYPNPVTTPPGRNQCLASLIMELAADEWFNLLTLHYRWDIPANALWAQEEFGRNAFPWLPRALATRLAGPVARQMQAYRPVVGISPSTVEGIERFATMLIRSLESHFASHGFLLGERPCLGDFALFGPLWAHLYRDPHSRFLFDDAPHCVRWMEALAGTTPDLPPSDSDIHHRRTMSTTISPSSQFLAGDDIPASLDPIFAILFSEQWPFLHKVIDVVDTYLDANPDAKRVPRAFGNGAMQVGGAWGERKLVSFQYWKVQRVFATYKSLDVEDRTRTDAWLQRVGGLSAMSQAPRHCLERVVGGPFEEVRPIRPIGTPLSRL